MDTLFPYAFRLEPGQDLKETIEAFAAANEIKAGWVSTCVGSLTQYAIRFANQPGPSTCNGHFEITSLSGTVSINGCHLHIAISDGAGKMLGGHLCKGCIIYTTAEIVLLTTHQFIFTREQDGTTPWAELQINTPG